MTNVPAILRFGSIAALLAALVVGLSILGRDLKGQYEDLATADTDNVQYMLSQAEVEFLALELALARAKAAEPNSLATMRKRFDIFYSRVNILRTSPMFGELREQETYNEDLDAIWSTVDAGTRLIDSDDATLKAGLDTFQDDLDKVRTQVRDVSLLTINHFAQLEEVRRAGLTDTLLRVAALTAFLIFALLLAVAVLWRSIRSKEKLSQISRSSASRMSAVVSSSLDAVIVADTTGTIIEANEAVQEVFGFKPEDLIGREMGDTIVPPHLRDAHNAGFKRYNETGSKHVIGKGRVQLEGAKQDGALFPVELSISAAETPDGDLFVSFLRDITQRVATEQELLEARDTALQGQRAKAQMLATMSHEMRTPLNGILGTLELVADTSLDERQRQLVSIARQSGDMLLHHVNDVLDISRLDAGKMVLERSEFDLNELIQSLLDGQIGPARKMGNRLHLSPLVGNSMVIGDPNRVRQVILNLVSNALKFTNDGEITVEVERLSLTDNVEIRVADTGVGIAEDAQARMFDDFVTLDSSYKRTQGGTGLGLGIVRRMTEAMNGEVSVVSELGEGSLFTLTLPLPPSLTIASVAQTPSTREKTDGESPSSRENILLVEDNEINRMIAKEMLVSLGHSVTEAVDGQEGVDRANETRFDLVLMDISMPRMDGVTATRTIRAGHGPSREVPIVALTAHALPDELARFEESGMQKTLIKPVTREALSKTIAGLKRSPASRTAKLEAHAHSADTLFVDEQVLAQLSADAGESRLTGLVRAFLHEADREVASLSAPSAREITEADLVARIHKLAGSAATFGAKILHAELSTLEARCKSGKMSEVYVRLPGLADLWSESRPHYEAVAPDRRKHNRT